VRGPEDPPHVALVDKNKPPSREKTVKTYSKNERGVWKNKQLEESVSWMECNDAFAVGLQETWRTSDFIEEHRDYTILTHRARARRPEGLGEGRKSSALFLPTTRGQIPVASVVIRSTTSS
jgi:hypothetical protein